MASKRILVVDDDPGIRKGCSRALEGEGYEVVLAADGAEALRVLGQAAPDLVLTDLEMPEMSGLQLLREVRTRRPQLPVILFTGFSTIESAGEALGLGAAGYITKPFELEELFRVVRGALAGEAPEPAPQREIVSQEMVLGTFLNHLLKLISGAVRVDECQFMIVSDDGQRLVTRATSGGRGRLGDTLPLSLPGALAQPAKAGNGDTLPLALPGSGPELKHEGDPRQDPRFKGLDRLLAPTSEVLPVCGERGQVLGLLIAGRAGDLPFDEPERSLLRWHARYAAVLIEHARAYEELKSTCRRLEEAQDRLVQQAKLSVVGQVVSGLVHDINNPLTSILTAVEHMRRVVPEGSLREDAEIVEKGAKALKAIVTGLMGFVRGQPVRMGPADTGNLIREAVALVEYQCRVKKIKTELRLQEPFPKVWIDGPQLQQVLLNLLMNSIQAMKKAGSVRVWAGTLPATDSPLRRPTLSLSVSDDGPGFSTAHLDKVFEPFFTTKKKGEGTGLGLSRSREIVEGNGGMIWAENAPEGGAVVRIYLPAEPAPPADAKSRGAAQPRGRGAAPPPARQAIPEDGPARADEPPARRAP